MDLHFVKRPLVAAATVIAAVHHDNTGLHEELAGHGAGVALDTHRTARPC
ncbi:hypothetical protein [Streptomyces atratus]